MICKHLQLAARVMKPKISTAPFVTVDTSFGPPSADSFSSLSNFARPRPPTHSDTSRHTLETASAALSIAGEMTKLNRLTQRYGSFTPEIALAGRYELSTMVDALSHLESAFRLLNLRNQPLYARQRSRQNLDTLFFTVFYAL